MSILNSLAQQLTQSATVVAVTRVATHALRLTLGGPALRWWAYVPGQTLNVFFGLAARGEAASLRKRTYSVWGYDPTQGYLELAVCTFSAGPGARWAEQCQPGDTVHFHGPGGKFVLEPAPAYALLGDISCLAHFYALRRRIPAHVPVVSVIHARQVGDSFVDLDGSQPLHVMVADTLSAAQYLAEVPLRALLVREPQALVYWGGPQATCVAGHRLLQQQHGWPAGQLKTKPFWK